MLSMQQHVFILDCTVFQWKIQKGEISNFAIFRLISLYRVHGQTVCVCEHKDVCISQLECGNVGKDFCGMLNVYY